ncbi:MAG: hypothetical protein CL840_13645 [Crocinitomicaceae bacterium]|nr:hypothetical protein [Crocinitomicaceae bacterium]|tara:strand:- start:1615 stop:3498 length:1884 start_codon:yes stop_codon:yes gene_type:complete
MKKFLIINLMLLNIHGYASRNDSSNCVKAEEQVHIKAILNPGSDFSESFDELKSCSDDANEFSLKKAKFLFNKAKYELALKSLNELTNGNQLSADYLGEAYYYLGRSNFELGNYIDAIDAFKQSIEAGYNKWDNNFELARSYYRNGETSKAGNLYIKIVKQNKYNSNAWNNLGVTYEDSDMDQWALTCFLTADSITRGTRPLYSSNIINSYWRQGMNDEALKFGEKAYKKFPNHPRVVSNYGLALNDARRNEQAFQICRKYLKENPPHHKVLFRMGYTFSEQGMFDSALVYYFQSIAINPNQTYCLGNIAWIYLIYGHNQKALEYAEMSLVVDSNFEKGYGYKYDAYADMRKYGKAMEMLSIYQRKFPTNKLLPGRLGYMNLMLGNFEVALEYFKKDIEDGPASDSKPYNNSGRCYAKLGDTLNAMKFFDMAIKINPKNSFIYHNRASMYESLGDYDLACRDMKKSIELEYNWDIDSNLLTTCKKHCPEVNLNRRIIYHGYKGNKEELLNLSMIEVIESDKNITDSTIQIASDKVKPLLLEENVSRKKEFGIYPNPSNGQFQLKTEINQFGKTIRIFNESSHQVFESRLSDGNSTPIDISGLKNGMYILIVSDQKNVLYSTKILLMN